MKVEHRHVLFIKWGLNWAQFVWQAWVEPLNANLVGQCSFSVEPVAVLLCVQESLRPVTPSILAVLSVRSQCLQHSFQARLVNNLLPLREAMWMCFGDTRPQAVTRLSCDLVLLTWLSTMLSPAMTWKPAARLVSRADFFFFCLEELLCLAVKPNFWKVRTGVISSSWCLALMPGMPCSRKAATTPLPAYSTNPTLVDTNVTKLAGVHAPRIPRWSKRTLLSWQACILHESHACRNRTS